jgi:hypothetical protein
MVTVKDIRRKYIKVHLFSKKKKSILPRVKWYIHEAPFNPKHCQPVPSTFSSLYYHPRPVWSWRFYTQQVSVKITHLSLPRLLINFVGSVGDVISFCLFSSRNFNLKLPQLKWVPAVDSVLSLLWCSHRPPVWPSVTDIFSYTI